MTSQRNFLLTSFSTLENKVSFNLYKALINFLIVVLWKIHDDSPWPQKNRRKVLNFKVWASKKIHGQRSDPPTVSLSCVWSLGSKQTFESLSSKKETWKIVLKSPSSSNFFSHDSTTVLLFLPKKRWRFKRMRIHLQKRIILLYPKNNFQELCLEIPSCPGLDGPPGAWGRSLSLVGDFNQSIWKIYARSNWKSYEIFPQVLGMKTKNMSRTTT